MAEPNLRDLLLQSFRLGWQCGRNDLLVEQEREASPGYLNHEPSNLIDFTARRDERAARKEAHA